MSRTHRTKLFKIDQPVQPLFPLFCAECEKLRVPDWDYENIMRQLDVSKSTTSNRVRVGKMESQGILERIAGN